MQISQKTYIIYGFILSHNLTYLILRYIIYPREFIYVKDFKGMQSDARGF